MHFKGVIKAVSPIQSFAGRDGREYRKIEAVAETNERYPQSVVFTIENENIERYPIQLGAVVELELSFRAREYKQRWFNQITAWKVISSNW